MNLEQAAFMTECDDAAKKFTDAAAALLPCVLDIEVKWHSTRPDSGYYVADLLNGADFVYQLNGLLDCFAASCMTSGIVRSTGEWNDEVSSDRWRVRASELAAYLITSVHDKASFATEISRLAYNKPHCFVRSSCVDARDTDIVYVREMQISCRAMGTPRVSSAARRHIVRPANTDIGERNYVLLRYMQTESAESERAAFDQFIAQNVLTDTRSDKSVLSGSIILSDDRKTMLIADAGHPASIYEVSARTVDSQLSISASVEITEIKLVSGD